MALLKAQTHVIQAEELEAMGKCPRCHRDSITPLRATPNPRHTICKRQPVMDAGAFNHLGEAVAWGVKVMIGIIVVSVPLAIWKLIDIIIFLVNHINVSIH